MSSVALFVAVFLACLVEAVEALTIVLAAGMTRDWRSAIVGVNAALGVLVVLVAALGPALTTVPVNALRLVVGALMLIFGLQWLRKAILRAGGHKDLHDESAIFAAEVTAAREAPLATRAGVRDWYAFTLSFKGVLLEGLEVAIIAVAFGTGAHNVPLAALAAAAAVVIVATTGWVARRPLARVPENTMKFVVGVLLTGFGIFWGAEGAGAHWPGEDAALLVLIPAVGLFALVQVAALRRYAPGRYAPAAEATGIARGGVS